MLKLSTKLVCPETAGDVMAGEPARVSVAAGVLVIEMNPSLMERLRRTLHQGKGRIRWNYTTIVHRMQTVFNCFLAYHGWQSGGSLAVKAVSDGWEGPGNFGVKVDIHLKFNNQHEWQDFAISRALAWVLWALFEYAEELGLGRPEFW